MIAGACGVLIALPSLRVKGPYLAMVTLAFGIVVEKLVGEWTEVFGGAQGIYGIAPLTWNGQPFSAVQWVWFGIVLCAVTHLLLRNLSARAASAARCCRCRRTRSPRRRSECGSIAPR